VKQLEQEDFKTKNEDVTISSTIEVGNSGGSQKKLSDWPQSIPSTTTDTKTRKTKTSKVVEVDDSYNGRTTDKYSWSQTINEIDVKIPVSTEIKKGKQLSVTITGSELKVIIPGVSGEPLVYGKFTFPVKKDDSYWNLIPGEAVRIWLQKSQER
jgi:hypothetical protein